MGFTIGGSGLLSKRPVSTAANRITSGAVNAQALAVRANAALDASTYISSVEDPAGVPVHGIQRYGKAFFQGQNADPLSARTEFWQQSDAFPRVALNYSQFGAGMEFGPGATQADAVLSRTAPVGVSTVGTFAQGGRRFERLGYFNVQDYGAQGNDIANDGPAIQAAIDACAAAGGGVVFFPKGSYKVDCSTVGLTPPNQKHMVYMGEVPPTTAMSTKAVRIIRSAGSATLLENPNDGTSHKASYSGLEFNGNGTTGRVALLWRLGQVILRDLNFNGQASGVTVTGVSFPRCWNVVFNNCLFNGMGNGTTAPATRFTDIIGENETSTNTVLLAQCHWESNRGIDIDLTRNTSPNKAAAVLFNTCKMEYNSDLMGSVSHSWPIVRFGPSHTCHFGQCFFYAGQGSGAGAAPLIEHNNGEAQGNSFSGCTFEKSGGSGTNYLVDQTAGFLSISGCYFANYSGSVTAGWRVVGTDRSQGAANIYYDTAKKHANGTPSNTA